ncbi:MAG: patatin-like phospholipase family protein [Campylobacterota bacterium]|nr:patatin-like phospholipase family protein [Campylobacterota bacterium]
MGDIGLYEQRRYCLSLSGGGVRGAFHLGVLQYLYEQNIQIEAISGSSIGAIIGAFYSAGIEPKKQLEIFSSKEFKEIFKFNYFKQGVFKIDEKAKILKNIIPYKNIEDLPIPLYVSTLNMTKQKKEIYNKGSILPILLGSSAIIPLLKPIKYNNQLLVDGGFVDNLPISKLNKYNSKIIGINLHPMVKFNEPKSTYNLIKKTFRALWLNHTLNSIDNCDIYITTPQLLDYSLFKFKNMKSLYELGYEEAKKIKF